MIKFTIIVCTLFAVGVFYQMVATAIDNYRYPPPGRLVEFAENSLHMNIMGEGKYTIVLDAGLGGTSIGWSLVQPEVSKFARVCSVDRAGYAWSKESASKRTSHNIAEELYSCLNKANIAGPYILVGHSFGGCNVLMFAHKYPGEVKGVVLVDSVQEEMLKTLPQEPKHCLHQLVSHPRFQWFLAFIGYKRLRGLSAEMMQMLKPLPEKARDIYIAQMNKALYVKTVAREMHSLEESLSQLEKSAVYLYDKPLTVISAGLYANKEEGLVWRELQKKLLLKSSHVKHVVAEQSDHMINHHQPDIIINEILKISEDEVPAH